MESSSHFLIRHHKAFIKPLLRVAQAVASPLTNTFRRTYATTSSPESSSDQSTDRIVVLGSGWAGYTFARSLSRKALSKTSLISPRSHFVFTPLLASTSVGTLEFRATVEPVRRLGRSLDFRQGRAEAVDFARKVVRIVPCTDGEGRTGWLEQEEANGGGSGPAYELPYDKLVVAVGARAQTFGIEGVREHAHFLRDVGDARAIRQRVLSLFEEAHAIFNKGPLSSPASEADLKRINSLLHFAVVGGGPTGVEFAAELHDLIHEDLCKLYPPALTDRVKITLFDVAPTVLPMFEQALSGYATELFRRSGIEMRTETPITAIKPAEESEAGESGILRLSVKASENGNGLEGASKKMEEVDVGLVVWSTGLAPNPLVEKLGHAEFRMSSQSSPPAGDTQKSQDIFRLLTDPKTGSVVTDDHLRARIVPVGTPAGNGGGKASTMSDVFIVGDCAVIESASSPLPRTAQVASQQAAYLAKRLSRNDLDTAKGFRFRNLGMMAYLGGWKAIHQSSVDQLSGWAAWVLWRTAYITRSLSIKNKIMVPVYWAISWIFGRDISRF